VEREEAMGLGFGARGETVRLENGDGGGFLTCGRARKAALGTIPRWGQPPATILSPANPDSSVSYLPSQSDRSKSFIKRLPWHWLLPNFSLL
jgi:hypothetical protein